MTIRNQDADGGVLGRLKDHAGQYYQHRVTMRGRCIFDSPFFGAKVFLPILAASILSGLLVGYLRPAWYWKLPVVVLCFVVVFGVVLGLEIWEGRKNRP